MAGKKAKKKKRRAAAVQAGVDPQERRRERIEARRAERAAEVARARKAAQRQRIIRAVVLALALFGLIWFFLLRNATPSEIDGHRILTFSAAGENQHTDGTVEYETTPPVAGEHAFNPAVCGVHRAQIEDEAFVHSLEHGAVAALYDPATVPVGDIRKIEAIVSGFDEGTISAPYDGMEEPINVVSWGERMPLDDLDQGAVREYIDAFRNRGPESGRTCSNEADDPFELEPTPSPSPSPSPEEDAGGG